MSNAAVDPAEVPVFTGDLDLLESKVKALSHGGSEVETAGSDVHKSFGGLAAFYKAPEAEQLFGVTKPVADKAHDLHEDMRVIAKALGTYAHEITPLVHQLNQLKRDAAAFRDKVAGDEDWREDGDLIEENLGRRNKIAEVWAAFQAAERACHAKIVGLVGGHALHTIDASHKTGYGYDAEALKASKSLPWGDAVEESVPWWQVWEHAYDFGKGVIVDGAWGTVKGLLTLFGWDGADAAGEAWKGLAKLSTSMSITLMPVVGAAYWLTPGDKLPSWLRDSRTAMVDTGKALVAWDQWESNGSRAAGAVTFNVLTALVTRGGGAALSGTGKAATAAKALSIAAKAGEVIDPMAYVFKGAGAGLSKLGDVIGHLKNTGHIEIPKISDGAFSLPEGAVKLPDGTVQLPKGLAVPDGATKLPDGRIKLPEGTATFPPHTVKDPVSGKFMDGKGALYNKDGSLFQRAEDAPKAKPASPATGADNPRVETPTRQDQPVLAGVGGRGDDVTRVGSDISDPERRAGDSAGQGNAGPADNTPMGRAGDDTPTNSHSPGSGGNASHTQGAGGLDNSTGGDGHTPERAALGSSHGDGTPGGTADGPVEQSGDSGHEATPGSEAGSTSTDGWHEPPADAVGDDASRGSEGAQADGIERVNEPLPELTTQERTDHWHHLDEVEQRHLGDFDHLQRDPDKNGGISEPSKDEARVGLDLREQDRIPDDIQRPTEADRGEFYSPSTGKYYDIKGVHSDWPPFNNVRDKSQPFRGAYDPSNNARWVKKLSEQIVDKGRTVILDVRNANQAAIDDVKSIVQKNGWEDDVIWYP
ncbi:hypothetical protein [Streptomyces lydicus]|uniref:hypothetical protein n=1 Tax=Streptomyces lydicus TaxID=47763 RepID=UPI0036E96CC3